MDAAMNTSQQMRVVRIIYDEHRSLAAVLHGMRYLERKYREDGKPPRFEVLRAMLHYIDSFPQREHHPKEDSFLFARMRLRTFEAGAVLADLEAEHKLGEEMIRHLEQGLFRFEEGGAAYFGEFSTAVEAYCDFHYQHMRKEEDLVLPLAQRVLTEADWEYLDAAFSGNLDPLKCIGEHEDFAKLFTRIVMLAPQPIGLGTA
jgi:hemerythrin-like domain-containing protein